MASSTDVLVERELAPHSVTLTGLMTRLKLAVYGPGYGELRVRGIIDFANYKEGLSTYQLPSISESLVPIGFIHGQEADGYQTTAYEYISENIINNGSGGYIYEYNMYLRSSVVHGQTDPHLYVDDPPYSNLQYLPNFSLTGHGRNDYRGNFWEVLERLQLTCPPTLGVVYDATLNENVSAYKISFCIYNPSGVSVRFINTPESVFPSQPNVLLGYCFNLSFGPALLPISGFTRPREGHSPINPNIRCAGPTTSPCPESPVTDDEWGFLDTFLLDP